MKLRGLLLVLLVRRKSSPSKSTVGREFAPPVARNCESLLKLSKLRALPDLSRQRVRLVRSAGLTPVAFTSLASSQISNSPYTPPSGSAAPCTILPVIFTLPAPPKERLAVVISTWPPILR